MRFLGLLALLVVGGGLFVVTARADASPSIDAALVASTPVLVYKTPTCGCCGEWVKHLQEAGFEVETRDLDNLTAIKAELGVDPKLQSCHTAVVGDYVVEGHVPADVIARILEEQPSIAGVAVPGMPVGSPGMEMGSRVDPYEIIAFDHDGNMKVYERRP